jgi:hypothetical protein
MRPYYNTYGGHPSSPPPPTSSDCALSTLSPSQLCRADEAATGGIWCCSSPPPPDNHPVFVVQSVPLVPSGDEYIPPKQGDKYDLLDNVIKYLVCCLSRRDTEDAITPFEIDPHPIYDQDSDSESGRKVITLSEIDPPPIYDPPPSGVNECLYVPPPTLQETDSTSEQDDSLEYEQKLQILRDSDETSEAATLLSNADVDDHMRRYVRKLLSSPVSAVAMQLILDKTDSKVVSALLAETPTVSPTVSPTP